MRRRFFRGVRERLSFRRLLRWLLPALALWLVLALLLAVTIHLYGRFERSPQPADVIIVLGAGVRADGRPGPALTRRSTHAADLWHNGLAPRIICSGGMPGHTHRSEADACAEILRGLGVPAAAILLEDASRSTEENAIQSHKIMAANGWQTAILVSDGFHILRAEWIFRLRGVNISLSPVIDSRPGALEYALQIGREIVALHWQVFKEIFNVPITYVKSI
ncbi:MAG: YdcF family protein [Chloroflexi bacterium]|nr:YdcF family protein [Chloroflexota bacterium]